MPNDQEFFHHNSRVSRRALATIAAGGATAAAMLGNIRSANAVANDSLSGTAGVKLIIAWNISPTDDDLKFLNEIGFKYVYCPTREMMTAEEMLAVKKRYADAGITVHDFRYFIGGKAEKPLVDMMLDLPGREESMEVAKTWIRNTAKAGFDYTGGRLMNTGLWGSGEADARGGATGRDFDAASPNAHGEGGTGYGTPSYVKPAGGVDTLYYGRKYSYDELMGNFKKYFVKEMVPVLEESCVFMAFHPDDPPLIESLGVVARFLNNYQHIKNMFAAADSPNVGIQMCCGIWNEGGDLMGKDTLSTLKEFWALKKYREVHLRNISSPPVNGVPHFHETFQDNGYYDMYKIMKTLVDINYTGVVHFDHTPKMVGAPLTYPAYAAGFMHACLYRAMAEPKG
ncbi:MAG TPA: mannonate dehydratase, partial [Rhizomicrobium sp.]|nr:mannonate dehydratase [Rhizomicrobium sp.]